MSNLSQQTLTAYEVGAGASMATTYTVFLVILVGLMLLLLSYVVYILVKGVGDRSIKWSDMLSVIVSGIVLIVITLAFFTFTS